MSAGDLFLVPFSLLCGFAVYWKYSAIRYGASWFFVLWGIPFVLAGVYVIAGRFFWEAKRRSATFYGVTEKRVIVKSGVWRPSTGSVNFRTLADLSMTERVNGSGDIVLGPIPPFISWFTGSGWPVMNPSGVLESPDVVEIRSGGCG
jgi:hypothetical protein